MSMKTRIYISGQVGYLVLNRPRGEVKDLISQGLREEKTLVFNGGSEDWIVPNSVAKDKIFFLSDAGESE